MSAETPLTLDQFEPVTLEDWERRVDERSGDDQSGRVGRLTPDGVDVRPLYTAADLERPQPSVSQANASGDGWSLCVRIEDVEPLGVASEMVDAVAGGGDAVWLRLDRAARLGIEVDAPDAVEHVGRGGAALHHGTDLELVFRGATLGGASLRSDLWLDAGGNALPASVLVMEALGRCGVDLQKRVLHCGADPLGALARDGVVPRDLMKLESEMTVLARFSSAHLAGGRAVTVSTLPYQLAGADVVQELSYAVATLSAYLGAMERSGLEVGDSAAEISLRLGVGQDLFVEMAKLRAARLLWSMVLGTCGVQNVPSALIHAVGSERTLTRRDPWNNLLRSTGHTVGAVCGGADAVTLVPFDGALGRPEARARRLARTTQLVLAEEAGLGRVADPGAGSYYLEALTRQLAEQAWVRAREIEVEGGMRQHLLSGELSKEVERSADRRRRAVETGDRPITGVSTFVLEGERALAREGIDFGELARRAAARLAQHRGSPSEACEASSVVYSRDFVIDELTAVAADGATLADLADRLGDSEGAEQIAALPLRRDAEPFEGDLEEGV